MDEELDLMLAQLAEEGESPEYLEQFKAEYQAEPKQPEEVSEVPNKTIESELETSEEELGGYLAQLEEEGESPEYIEQFKKEYEDAHHVTPEEGEWYEHLNFLKIEDTEDGDGKLEATESMSNSWNNMIDHIGLIDDRFQYLSEFAFGSYFDDPSHGVEGTNFKAAEKEIARIEGQSGETIGFTDLDTVYEEEGILSAIAGTGAAITNAMTSLGSSVVLNSLSGGTALAVDMISTSVKDFNDEKAATLGITVQQLVENGQGEVMLPAALGSLAYSFERFGLGKIGKSINKMPIGWKRNVYNALGAAGTEGATEFSQGMVDAFGIGLAGNDNDISKTGESIVDFLENDALETILQGAVGGGIATGVGGLRHSRAARAARTEGNVKAITSSLNTISELNEVLANPETSPEEKTQIRKVKQDLKKRLSNDVNESYEALKEFDEAQIEEVAKLGEDLTTIQSKLDEAAAIPGVSGLIATKEAKQQVEEKQKEIDEKVKETQKEILKEKKEALKPESATTPKTQTETTKEPKSKVIPKGTPASQILEQLAAEQEAERVTDVDQDIDIDPIDAAFGPVGESTFEPTSVEAKVQTISQTMKDLVSGKHGEPGSPQYNAKLAEQKKLDDEVFYATKKNPRFSLELRNQNAVGQEFDMHGFRDVETKADVTGQFMSEIKNEVGGKKFGMILTGDSPNNRRLARKEAEHYGLAVTPHPANSGESLIHEPGVNVLDIINFKPHGNRDGYVLDVQEFAAGKDKGKWTDISLSKLQGQMDQFSSLLQQQGKAKLNRIENIAPGELALLKHYLGKQGYDVKENEFRNKKSLIISKKGVRPSIKTTTKSKVNAKFLKEALAKLKRVAPGVKVVFDPKAYQKAIDNFETLGMVIPQDAKGFELDGVVYLDTSQITPDTPFHEYGHLFVDTMYQNNREMFDQGVELLKGSEFEARVAAIPFYQQYRQDGNEQEFWKEVMTTALGEAAVRKFEDDAKQSKFKEWYDAFSNWIKEKLGIKSKKNFNNLTLNEWLDTATTQFLKEESIAERTARAFESLGIRPSIVEKYNLTKDDIARARKQIQFAEFNKKGIKAPKGWSKEAHFAELIENRLMFNAKKNLAKEQGAVAEVAEDLPIDKIPVYKKLVSIITKFKNQNKKSLSQGRLKHFNTIPDETLMRAVSKAVQKLEPGVTNVASFIRALGNTAFPKQPEGMDKEEFAKTQADMGKTLARILWDKNGANALDVEFDFILESNVVHVKDEDQIDQLATAIAQLPPDSKDFRSVSIGKPPAKMTGAVDKETGRPLISRRHAAQKMEGPEYQHVYDNINKVSEQGYEIDQEQLGLIQQLYDKGLLVDESKDLSDTQRRSINRAIQKDLAGAHGVGENVFYEAHNYVHNGRVQVMSTDVSHQSAKYMLSMFSFDKKDAKPIGEAGWKWLKILAQDAYGFAGDLLTQREENADKMLDKWVELSKDPLSDAKIGLEVKGVPVTNLEYIMSADVPALFLRHILELQRALNDGDPTNYKSAIPAHMDATTSGIQVLAGLTKDQQAATMSNLINTKTRSDSYLKVANKAWGELESTLSLEDQKAAFNEVNENQDEISEYRKNNPFPKGMNEAELKAFKKQRNADINAIKAKVEGIKDEAAMYFWNQAAVRAKMRKIVKKPVMTKYYSSPIQGIAGSIFDQWNGYKGFEGLTKSNASFLAKKLFNAADELMPGPAKLMDTLIEVAKQKFDENGFISYHNPVSNFKVVNDPKVSKNWGTVAHYEGENKGLLKENDKAEIEISIAFDTEEKDLKSAKKQVAPFVTHSFDAAIVHWMIQNTKYPLNLIHDSFATTPAHAEQMYADIRKGFFEIMEGAPLLNMLTEVLGDKVQAQEYYDEVFIGDWNPQDVKENEYAFSAGVSDPALNDPNALSRGQEARTAEKFEDNLVEDTIDSQSILTKEEAKPCK